MAYFLASRTIRALRSLSSCSRFSLVSAHLAPATGLAGALSETLPPSTGACSAPKTSPSSFSLPFRLGILEERPYRSMSDCVAAEEAAPVKDEDA